MTQVQIAYKVEYNCRHLFQIYKKTIDSSNNTNMGNRDRLDHTPFLQSLF